MKWNHISKRLMDFNESNVKHVFFQDVGMQKNGLIETLADPKQQ